MTSATRVLVTVTQIHAFLFLIGLLLSQKYYTMNKTVYLYRTVFKASGTLVFLVNSILSIIYYIYIYLPNQCIIIICSSQYNYVLRCRYRYNYIR